MFYRNVSRDDPVRDAEDAQRDDRPVVGKCDQCGEEIHGSTEYEYGDEIFNFKGIMVHTDCLSEWTRQFIEEVK